MFLILVLLQLPLKHSVLHSHDLFFEGILRLKDVGIQDPVFEGTLNDEEFCLTDVIATFAKEFLSVCYEERIVFPFLQPSGQINLMETSKVVCKDPLALSS